jgi:predicted nucleic-acid-binding protein
LKGFDTNVLVRFLTADDAAQHGRAARRIAELVDAGERARLDVIVLCELVWVLESGYGFDRAELAGALEAVLDAEPFEVESRELVRHAVARYREGSGGFADHLVGLRNRAAGCDVTLTFDRALHRSSDFAPV